MLGLDPRHLTLREMLWMADAKFDHDWSQTGLLATLLFNANKPKTARRAKPEDYNPWAKRRKKKRKAKQSPDDSRAAFLAFKKEFNS